MATMHKPQQSLLCRAWHPGLHAKMAARFLPNRPEAEPEMFFTSTGPYTNPDSVEDDEMRSDRLTRKTHFRKLSPKTVQRNAEADSVFDLTIENQTAPEDLGEGLWPLAELTSMAQIMDADTVQEHPY